MITILDEFLEEHTLESPKKQSARGLLSKYANPALQKEEETAWERAVEEKYGNLCRCSLEAAGDCETRETPI